MSDDNHIGTARTIATFLAVGLLLVMLAATAYYCTFAVSLKADDEGYMMALIDQVHRGKVLGDEVFTQYGPAYPLTYAGFFSLTGLEVNHDSIGVITIAIWLLTMLACSFACYAATGDLAVSLVVLWLVFQFGTPSRLSSEPGHPQGVVTLAAAMIPGVAAVLLPARKRLFCGLAGRSSATR